MAALGTVNPAALRRSAFLGTPANAQSAPGSLALPPPARGAVRIEAAQKLLGTVVSMKMQKTAVVEVVRQVPHPRYIKRVRKSKKYFAHDEEEECRVGDYVEISPTRPISKHKTFMVSNIIRRAS